MSEYAPGQICWIDVAVPDVSTREELMAFLAGMFDWTFEVGGPETGHYTMAFLDGKPVAAINTAPEGTGVWVVYFATPDIESSVASVTRAGGQVFMGPMQVMAAGSMALALDPSGAPFGLWQRDDFAGFGVWARVDAPCWFNHQSPDADKASAFYVDALDMQANAFAPGGPYMLMRGEMSVASVSTSPGDFSSYWNVIIGTSDAAASEERARALGADVLMSQMEVPGGVASSFQAAGSVITVFQSADLAPRS